MRGNQYLRQITFQHRHKVCEPASNASLCGYRQCVEAAKQFSDSVGVDCSSLCAYVSICVAAKSACGAITLRIEDVQSTLHPRLQQIYSVLNQSLSDVQFVALLQKR